MRVVTKHSPAPGKKERKRVPIDPERVSFRCAYAVIVLVALLAHGLCLKAGFYMDDGELILKLDAVRSGPVTGNEVTWRWIPYLVFAFTYRVFGASSPAFHVTNLTLHVAVSCLLFAAARDMFSRLHFLKTDALRRNAAFFGALVFACHPLCSEPVNYARCTMIEFVTLFSVLAAWMAVRFFENANGVAPIRTLGNAEGRGMRPELKWGLWLLAALGLAACSKNPGIFHALSNAGLVCLAMGGLRKLAPMLKWRVGGKRWLLAVPIGLLVLFLSYSWSWTVRGVILRWQDIFVVHMLTQGRIFWEYVARMVVPVRLCSDHYVAWSGGFGDVEAVLKTAGFLLISGVAFAGLFFKRFRVIALLICLVLAPFLLRLLYPIKELMVEYRTYPAMPWVGLLAGIGMALLYEKQRLVGTAAAALLIGGFSALSAARSTVWASPVSLAENVREQYPLNGRAITHLQGAAFADSDFARVVALKRDMEEATEKNVQYNLDHSGVRAYEYIRAQENYCNSEQLVVYALAHWQGGDVALKYADARLAELSKKLPRFYLSPKTGEYHPQNSLVKARQFVKSRMTLPEGG